MSAETAWDTDAIEDKIHLLAKPHLVTTRNDTHSQSAPDCGKQEKGLLPPGTAIWNKVLTFMGRMVKLRSNISGTWPGDSGQRERDVSFDGVKATLSQPCERR